MVIDMVGRKIMFGYLVDSKLIILGFVKIVDRFLSWDKISLVSDERESVIKFDKTKE